MRTQTESQQQKSVKTAPSGLHKYRTIIISIVLFLLFDLLILGLNYYYSFIVERSTEEINIAARQGSLIQQISKNLSDINLIAEREHMPQRGNEMDTATLQEDVFKQFNELDRANTLFDQSLKAMAYGGQTINAKGQTITLNPINIPKAQSYLQNAITIWEPFLGLNERFISGYKGNQSTLENIQFAADYARIYNVRLQEEMNDVVKVLEERAGNQANTLRLIQAIGIIVALGLFLFIVLRALRQLFLSDRALGEARKETTDILNTVNEGLFLIDRNLIIGSQYSQALSDILMTQEIADRRLENLLEQFIAPKEMKIAEEFIQQLFNERVKAKLITDLNPLDQVKVTVTDESGQLSTRHLQFGFSRVYAGDQIARVLVSVTNITTAVMLEQRLQRERIQNDEQVEMLTAILKVDERMINSFLRNARRTTENINNILRQSERGISGLKEKAQAIFREAHGLKGEASALGLSRFVSMTETLEDKVKRLNQQRHLTGNDFIPLAVSLNELISILDRVEGLVAKIGGFSSHQPSKDSTNTLLAKRSLSSNYDDYFNQFGKQIAQRNHKKVNVMVSGFDNNQLTEKQADLLKEVTIQLLRNAVVHGIETTEQRSACGKPEAGSVLITLSEFDEDNLELMVEDDGQGINYSKIKEKLKQTRGLSEQQLAKLDQRQLLAAAFSSGFSTLDDANEDAGRGVGTDVIKARLRELGGKFNLQTQSGQFTRFRMRFPKNGNII